MNRCHTPQASVRALLERISRSSFPLQLICVVSNSYFVSETHSYLGEMTPGFLSCSN